MADRWQAKLFRPIVMREGTKLMQAADPERDMGDT
jgi:hypothetical protein